MRTVRTSRKRCNEAKLGRSCRALPDLSCCDSQVGDECGFLLPSRFFILSSQDRGRVNSGHDVWSKRRWHELPSVLRDAEFPAKQRLRRRSAETNDHLRMSHPNLSLQPRTACFNFGISWLLVNPALTAFGRRPAEMFHSIGHINIFKTNSSLVERFVENPPRGPDKRVAGHVFFVTRLFSDQHDRRMRITFSENRLRGIFPQVATSALSGCVSKAFDRRFLGDETGCVPLFPGL